MCKTPSRAFTRGSLHVGYTRGPIASAPPLATLRVWLTGYGARHGLGHAVALGQDSSCGKCGDLFLGGCSHRGGRSGAFLVLWCHWLVVLDCWGRAGGWRGRRRDIWRVRPWEGTRSAGRWHWRSGAHRHGGRSAVRGSTPHFVEHRPGVGPEPLLALRPCLAEGTVSDTVGCQGLNVPEL